MHGSSSSEFIFSAIGGNSKVLDFARFPLSGALTL